MKRMSEQHPSEDTSSCLSQLLNAPTTRQRVRLFEDLSDARDRLLHAAERDINLKVRETVRRTQDGGLEITPPKYLELALFLHEDGAVLFIDASELQCPDPLPLKEHASVFGEDRSAALLIGIFVEFIGTGGETSGRLVFTVNNDRSPIVIVCGRGQAHRSTGEEAGAALSDALGPMLLFLLRGAHFDVDSSPREVAYW